MNFITQVWLKLRRYNLKKKKQTLHSFLNILIWIPVSAQFTLLLPFRLHLELQRCSHGEKNRKKDQCQATPSAPAQDAPAYKKAQATSRRVRRGRHLGDSPTERVSPWKLCQQQSVVVERLLCWCLFLNLGEDLLSWRQRVMERVDEHSTAPYCTYMWDKAVIALSVSPQVEWSEWYCPAECSMKLSLRLAPSLCMG